MVDDVFCKLYSVWKENNKIIYENNSFYAILSVTPAIPGQAMIISKRHVEKETDFTSIEASDLFGAIQKTFLAITELYNSPEKIKDLNLFYQSLIDNPPIPGSDSFAAECLADPDFTVCPVAYNYGVNKGKEAGQIINHFHLHLFPVRKPSKGVITAMRAQYQSSQKSLQN